MTERTDIDDPAESLLGRIVTWWALAGAILLAAIVAVNVWSVFANAVGLSFAGDFELTEMMVAIAVFTFLPYCQLTGQNVSADIFTSGLSRRTVAVLTALGSILALCFAILLLWRMWFGLQDQMTYGYATTILQIPVWWAFVPILISLAMLALAAIATLHADAREVR